MDLLSGKLIGSSVELYAEAAFAVGGNAFPTTTSRAMLTSTYAPSANYGYNYAPSTLSGRRFFGQLGSTFDVVHHFEIILDRGVKEVAVYDPLSLEIHAMDRNGNVVEDYTGTVQIFTTDPEALLPSEVRFTPGDFGIKRLSLSLRFQTPGEPNAIGEPTHVIRVEEIGTCASPSTAGCVFGELEVIVGGGGSSRDPERRINVTSPVNEGTVSGEAIMVEGKGPPFINLEIIGECRTHSAKPTATVTSLFRCSSTPARSIIHCGSATPPGASTRETSASSSIRPRRKSAKERLILPYQKRNPL